MKRDTGEMLDSFSDPPGKQIIKTAAGHLPERLQPDNVTEADVKGNSLLKT